MYKKSSSIIFFFILIASLNAQSKLPDKFKIQKWYELGEEKDVFSTKTIDIDNSRWIFPTFGRLIFLDGYYVYGTPWSGIESHGNYSIINNQIVFEPELIVPRWDEKYSIKSLLITTTNRKDKAGNQLLIDLDDTVSFYGFEYSNKPEYEIKNNIPCVPVMVPIRIKRNNALYVLPSVNSKNLLDERNYYGDKAIIGKSFIIYKPVDEKNDWVYISIDLTYDEPIDGGGPFYIGWIPRSYTSEVINQKMLVVTDNLRLRSKPTIDKNTTIIRVLKKWTIVKVVEIGNYIKKIDDIEDRWHLVVLDDGTKGWIFGGYAKHFSDEKELQELMELYKDM